MIEKIQALLTEDENIVAQGRIHEIVFVPSIIYVCIAFLVTILFHPLLGGVILFLAIYPIYNALIHYWMTYLVLTDKKVMSRAGFISRDWIRMDFERIENAYLEEPIIGRYLGYSTIIVSGVGSGNITVPYVRDGDNFVKLLEQQLADNRKEYKPSA